MGGEGCGLGGERWEVGGEGGAGGELAESGECGVKDGGGRCEVGGAG